MLLHPRAAASDEGALAFHGGAALPLGALADSTGTGHAVGFGGANVTLRLSFVHHRQADVRE